MSSLQSDRASIKQDVGEYSEAGNVAVILSCHPDQVHLVQARPPKIPKFCHHARRNQSSSSSPPSAVQSALRRFLVQLDVVSRTYRSSATLPNSTFCASSRQRQTSESASNSDEHHLPNRILTVRDDRPTQWLRPPLPVPRAPFLGPSASPCSTRR